MFTMRAIGRFLFIGLLILCPIVVHWVASPSNWSRPEMLVPVAIFYTICAVLLRSQVLPVVLSGSTVALPRISDVGYYELAFVAILLAVSAVNARPAKQQSVCDGSNTDELSSVR